MKKCALSIVLIFASTAVAQIIDVQNAAVWNCFGSGTSVSCPVNLGTTHGGNLLAVWTFWESSSTYVASVKDSPTVNPNVFVTAVGPTPQSAASTPTTSQIFYARSITGNTGADTVTVTFTTSSTGTPTISLAGVVAVEYQGLDPNNPLDDASAGYSLPGGSVTTFDSGWAPLSIVPPPISGTNMVIFGAAISDVGGGMPTQETGFTLLRSHNTGLCGLAEEYIFAATASVFQHATATCNGGDWLFQMAAFRIPSWSVAGGWNPARAPDEVNAAQYPGTDICIQAQNAALANPYATILMTITGTMPCSVDPSGGWISGFYSGIIPGPGTGPKFNGNIKLVGVVGSNPTLQIDVPWMIGRGPNGRNTWTDIGGVTIQASNNFRKNISGPRCFTASSSMNIITGVEATCSNLANSSSLPNPNPITIQAMKVGSCALVSLITSQGQSSTEGNGGYGDPQVYRGNQIVEIMNAADARNNGMFRMVPVSDTTTCGSLTGNRPAYNQFYIYAPSAQSCSPSGTSCGSSILIVAESPMFYVGLRDFDMPNSTPACSPTCSGDAGIDIDGTENDMLMIAAGNKLLNLGEVDGFGYGIVALDNHFGEEETWVTTIKSRAVMRTSMMTFGAALRNFGSQNTAGFSHWEDYCGDPFDTTDCYTDGTHLPFGLYHVGLWLRDGWGRVGAEDVTFNSSAYAPIMLDGMTGFTSGWTLKDIHFQNERTQQNIVSPGKKVSTASTGGNLCDIAIGFQSQAQSVIIEQVQADSLAGVLENICIAGSNHVPTTNLPDWSATYLANGGMFIPLTSNPGCSGGNCIMEVIAPVVGGTAVCQPWVTACLGGFGNCSTVGSTCSDGTLTYENIDRYFPNDIGPTSMTLVSGNVVATNLTEGGGGATGNIFNGVTNNIWGDQSISWYLFQDDSGSIDEESSSHEHSHRVDQGLQANAFTYSLANNPSAGTVVNELAALDNSTGTGTATVAGTSGAGVIGLVVAGAGAAGNAVIQWGGFGLCIFDTLTVTAGDYVQASSTPGKCTDAGPGKPASGQIIGRLITGGAAASQTIYLQMTQ